MNVPNKHPTYLSVPYRLAIVGEAPGRDEELAGEPFVGMSGRFLGGLMSRASLSKDACFVGNVSQLRPPGNDFSELQWHSDDVQRSIETLRSEIADFRPHLILCLGNASLHLAKEGNVAPPRHGYDYNYPNKITDWRGSLFWSTFFNCKTMATYHPAAVLRQYEWKPILHFDLVKASKEATFSDLHLPQRTLHTTLSADEIINRLTSIRGSRQLVSIDIEGRIDTMSCISFAIATDDSFTIPLARRDGSNYWQTEEEEVAIWRAMAEVLSDPLVPKVLQNSLYDRFILQYSYRIPVLGVIEDTMLKFWELYCELPKGLAMQASLLTEEPYWKDEGQE